MIADVGGKVQWTAFCHPKIGILAAGGWPRALGLTQVREARGW